MLSALAEIRFLLEGTNACPERVMNYNVEVRCLRRHLCLPLLEAQDGRIMLGSNNSTQRITYSVEASNGGFIGRGCGIVSWLVMCCVFRVFVYLWGRCPAPVPDSAAL